MSEEVNYLECSVCFKGYNDTPKQTPRSLYCGHTFCAYCLEQLATNNTIVCPTCRQKHALSQEVRECNKNFALLELLGKLKSPEVICTDCEEQKAILWCTDCTESYCGKCSKKFHKHKFLSGHKRVKLEEKPVNVICAEHEERYHFFCQDCIIPVCYICKDRDHGKHGGHTTQLLLNAESDKRELLEDRRSKLEETVKSLESKSQKVAETSKLVADNQAKHSREIQESTKALIDEINKRSLELISEIKNMASEKTESLQTYRAELGASFAAATALIEESKQLLNCDRLKLLLDVKDLVAKMDKSITSGTECSVKPITSSYIGCTLDKTDVIQAVKRFGGIGVPNIPENLKTSSITSTSAEISWNPSSLSSVPQDSVVIQYCQKEEKTSDWKALTISKDKTKTLITNFQPKTSYSVRICAANHVGRGQWTEEIKFQTKPTPPSPDTGFKGTTLLDGTSRAKLQEFLGDLKTGELLYKATLHGFAVSVFHQRCDQKGPTLTVIKRNGSSTIYGGYTPTNWDSTTQDYMGGGQFRSFVFTMSDDNGNPTKFQHKQTPTHAIYCSSSYGPTFGEGFTICIRNNSNTATGSCTNKDQAYDVLTNTTLCGQYNNYTIDDIEVFSVH